MESMEALANKHHADKGTARTSLATPGQYHNYVAVYEKYMEAYRNEAVSITEIGLGVSGEAGYSTCAYGENKDGGASFKMWQEYFSHPDTRVLGFDINSAPHLNRPPRATTMVLDQNNEKDVDRVVALLKEVGTTFRFIIDDGSHASYDQQMTLEKFWPLLQPGGVYFIEDLQVNPSIVNQEPNEVTEAPEELKALIAAYGTNSNKMTEKEGDLRTREVLERAQATGRLISPYITSQGAYAIETTASSFSVEACGVGSRKSSLLGVIVKASRSDEGLEGESVQKKRKLEKELV